MSASITQHQLELLKSFRYLTTEAQVSEVKELLSLYYRHKLDAAIDAAEQEKGFTAAVYESWLNSRESKA